MVHNLLTVGVLHSKFIPTSSLSVIFASFSFILTYNINISQLDPVQVHQSQSFQVFAKSQIGTFQIFTKVHRILLIFVIGFRPWDFVE